jgi:hypothetical protein
VYYVPVFFNTGKILILLDGILHFSGRTLKHPMLPIGRPLIEDLGKYPSQRILYSQIEILHQIVVLKIDGCVMQHDSARLQQIAP